MKNEINVFDPPMCCSSGVCGTSVNPELVRFAGDLEFLKKQGVSVLRYNLSSEPSAFVAEPLVKETLAKEGNDCLPLVLASGKIVSKARYPARGELMKWAGLEAEARGVTDGAQSAANSDCGPGCVCNCAPSSQKIKKTAGALVLVAALALMGVKLATAKEKTPIESADQPAFAVTAFAPSTAAAESATPDAPALQKLGSLNDLNQVAITQDAVLVYIPAASEANIPESTQAAMQSSKATLGKSKIALGLFTLPETASDYAMISAQTKAPAILVAAKGGGMLAIPAADTTEMKILQAFMTASSAGSCGSGGCGPSAAGCN